MKKHFLFAALAMTGLFSACNNEDDNLKNENEGKKVTFVIGGIDSRATTATDFSTTFDNGDAIGISGTNVTPEMSNTKYNISVSNSEATIAPDGSDSFTFGEGEAIFNAYYPYAEEFDGTFAVQTNQNEVNALSNSDFLTATAKGDKDNAEVQLDFKHRLVLVQVQLSGISNVSSVTLKNAQTNVTFTNGTDGTTQGTVALATDNATFSDIIMSEQTADELYWAIIPAQTIAASDLFIVSTSDGKNYKYTTNAATTFDEGTYAQYKLTLESNIPEPTLVQYKAVIISKWNAGVSVLDGTLEENLLNIVATLPAVGDVTTLTNGRSDLTEAGWGAFGLASAKVVEDTNGNYIDITGAAAQDSWPNNSLYYWAGSSKLMDLAQTYTISFYAKGSVGSEGLSLVVSDKNEAKVYQIVDGTTTSGTIKNFSCTNQYKLYSYIVNPALIASGAYGGTPNNTNTQYKEICIAFKPNSANAQIQIKDVTFVEN